MPLWISLKQHESAVYTRGMNPTHPLARRHALACLIATTASGACSTTAPPVATPVKDPPVPGAVEAIKLPPAAKKKPVIGLALGGGAARGFAHVGVIATLEKAGITPDWIVGTSAGSLVGALYASGLNAAALRTQALALDESALGDWTLRGRGVLKGQGLQDLVNRLVGYRKIEQFPRRFAVIATDLYNGSSRLFAAGDCGLAVRASSAVPTVFEPVSIDNREYVDGGLSSPIPVGSARALGCNIVIAVDISARPSFQPTETMPQVLLQTFAIMGRNLAERELAEADIRVRPAVSDLGATNFEARARAINDGEVAMRDQLPALLNRIRSY